jgi:SET and MYND domain-containing protein
VTHRKEGNDLYSRKRLFQSLDQYNKSILLGVWTFCSDRPFRPGQQLALAFGNRSAVLVELEDYELALRDVAVSLTADVPLNTRRRLLLRKLHCLLKLGVPHCQILSCEAELESFVESLSPSERDTVKEQVRKEMATTSSKGQPRLMNLVVTDGNPSSYQVSKQVEVAYDPQRGRFLVATARIVQGEVIISEDPYALVLNKEFHGSHCHFCSCETRAPFPCYYCACVQYCSVECMKEAWRKYHWFECFKFLELDWMSLLGLRVLLSSDPVQVNKLLSHKPKDPSAHIGFQFSVDYFSVYSLVTNPETTPRDLMQQLKLTFQGLVNSHGLSLLEHFRTEQSAGDKCGGTLSTSSGEETHSDKGGCEMTTHLLQELLLHHTLQAKYNTHAVTVLMDSVAGRVGHTAGGARSTIGGLGPTAGGEGSNVEMRAHTKIASAIYPSASLINHSCNPNAIVRFKGSHLRIVATEDIPQGKEVSICYGPHYLRMRKTARLESLKRDYGFLCKCSVCESSDIDSYVSEAVRCQGCSEAILLDEHASSRGTTCGACGFVLTADKVQDVVQQCACADHLFDDATLKMADRSNWEECLSLLVKCLSERQKVLYKFNKKLGETHDSLAWLFAQQGDFLRASQHCRKSVEIVEALFGSESIELAHELHKLAQLLFNSKQVKDAIVVTERAMKLLSKCTSQEEDLFELQSMLDCLLQVR